jgi:hypothetical protein
VENHKRREFVRLRRKALAMNATTKLLAILAAALLPTTSPAAEFSRELYKNFGYLTLTGKIIDGDFERFKQIAPRSTADGIQIILDSPGGNTGEGVAIGRYIHEHRLDTTVFRYCVSACALIWLAGHPRHVTTGVSIGFHAAGDRDSGASGWANAFVGAYLRDIGMSIATIIYATSAPPSSVNWLTPAKASELGIKIMVLEKGMDPPFVPPTPPAVTATRCKSIGYQNLYRCS